MTAMRSLSTSLQHMGRILRAEDAANLSDAELVGRFVERRDEVAFAALVRRHGPLVFGVCRRVLRHEQDAEDAFQATFLVLARNAKTVGHAGAIGNWLHGVAYNVARKAKTMRHRRTLKEQEAATRQPTETPAVVPDDLWPIVDAELHALPDKYRAAIVLCDLMGLTIHDAAAEVGCPPKTLGTRLGRGRTLLAGRLTRRGVAVVAGALPAILTSNATAAVPLPLTESTVRAAMGFVAGSATVAPTVAALTQGVTNVMVPGAIKAALLVTGSVLILGGLWVGPSAPVILATQYASVQSGKSDGSTPTGRMPQQSARPFDWLDTLHRLLIHAIHGGGKHANVNAVADDKPVLSGQWLRKDGEQRIDFTDKETLAISPHNKDDIILVKCSYTVDKDGLVKAKVTGVAGSKADALKDKLPVGTEFSFQWKAKADTATLEDLKGEKLEGFKSLLEGDYEKK